MALSRHPSEAGVEWRLALPHGEQVEAWEPGTTGSTPPPEIARLIKSITAGKDLVADPPPRELPSDEYGPFEELTRQLVSGRRQPDPVQHEPRRLLSHAEGAAELARADPAVREFAATQTAGSHLSSPSGEPSKIVPTLTENCRWHALHFQRRRVEM